MCQHPHRRIVAVDDRPAWSTSPIDAKGEAMTATSVLTPPTRTRPWTTAQRIAMLVVVIVLFSAIAFSVGRASAPVHRSAPAVTPVSAQPAGSPVDDCLRGRHC